MDQGQQFTVCKYCGTPTYAQQPPVASPMAPPPPGQVPVQPFAPPVQPFGPPMQYGAPMQPMYPPPQMNAPRINAGAAGAGVVMASIGAVVGVMVVMGAAGAMFFRASSSSSPPRTVSVTATSTPAPSDNFQFTDRPLLADVNDDGTQDLIGKCRRFVPQEEEWIGAYSGKDGKKLWSLPVSKDPAEWETRRAITGAKLLVVDSVGKVTAYHARNATAAWTATLAEKPRDVCAGADFVGIETADRQTKYFALADGAPRGAPPKGACKHTWVSSGDDGLGYTMVGWSEFRNFGIPDLHSIKGMDAHRALIPEDGRLRFMLGSKSPGTQVAMVAAVDGKKVVWSGLVPSVDPLTTSVNVTTQIAAVSQNKLVIPYQLNDHRTVRIACLEASTGNRLWDVVMPGVTGQVTHGIAIADGQVFYSTWTSVHVLSLASGVHKWSVGTD
jgi:hypothetical protein